MLHCTFYHNTFVLLQNQHAIKNKRTYSVSLDLTQLSNSLLLVTSLWPNGIYVVYWVKPAVYCTGILKHGLSCWAFEISNANMYQCHCTLKSYHSVNSFDVDVQNKYSLSCKKNAYLPTNLSNLCRKKIMFM